MMKTKIVGTGTAALMLAGAVGFGPGLVSAATAAPSHTKAAAAKSATMQGQAWNYTGTWKDKKGRTGVADVKIVPQQFWNDGGKLMMRSAVTTTTKGARGAVPHTKTMNLEVKDVTTGVAPGVSAASCDILNLVLGPLDLNLLGLEIHLDTVVLDIIAVPGAGNLLGNLLCAVAGLLDGGGLGGLLGQLSTLLNQILGILNGLGGLGA
jgi:hypothetical protein